MSVDALNARKDLLASLTLFPKDNAAAIAQFSTTSRQFPGCLPYANPEELGTYFPVLDEMRAAEPKNLTLRLAWGEAALSLGRKEEAQQAFVSIIRDLRPRNVLNSNVDASFFRSPAISNLIWHSIDLGREFIEGSRKNSRVLAAEMLRMHWPNVTGKSVLDIGAFGGWFSFEAERRGAASVTSMEFYSWVTDFPKVNRWLAEEQAAGRVANAYDPPDDCRDLAAQPGRIIFDLTRHSLRSKATPLVGRLEDTEIPESDIVLLLGVLYHQENPYWMLQKVAKATREYAIIETVGLYYPGTPHRATWEFYGRGQLRKDASTFWACSEEGLRDMLLRVGFAKVKILYGYEEPMPMVDATRPYVFRIWATAFK